MDGEYYRARAEHQIAGLRERFLELEARDFPATTPEDIIKHLLEILSKVQARLSAADEKTSNLVLKLLAEIQKLLLILDNAHSEQTPRGLVRVLEDLLVQRQIHPGPCKLIAAPQTSTYNYSIEDLTEKIYRAITNLFPKDELDSLRLTYPIYLISFPRMERDSTLLHTVFGHEVGHLVAFQYVNRAEAEPTFSDEFATMFAPIKARIEKEFQESDWMGELQKDQEILRANWKRGLEELISDYVGLLLFGPSMIFASYAVFSLHDLDKPPAPLGYYPPGRYRLRFLLKELRSAGFVAAFEELAAKEGSGSAFAAVAAWLKEMEKLTNKTNDVDRLKENPVWAASYDWIEKSLPAAVVEAKTKVVAITYTKEKLIEDVPELIQRINMSVPPSEIGTYDQLRPASWASAFVAGWCYAIRNRNPQGGILTLKGHQLVNQLTLRAVEAILLKEQYKRELQTKA